MITSLDGSMHSAEGLLVCCMNWWGQLTSAVLIVDTDCTQTAGNGSGTGTSGRTRCRCGNVCL